MKIYSISELETKDKQEIKEIIKEREKLLFDLVRQVLENEKIQTPKTNKIHETEKKTLFKISSIQVKEPMQHLDINKAVLLYLNLDVELSKKLSNDLDYNSEMVTSHVNDVLENLIDKKARVLWSVEKVKNNNQLEMRLLFPDNLILPDIVLFNEYKQVSKKAKKVDKENYKQEFQAKLDFEIEELSQKRFNLIKNNPAYFPENRKELLEFIKASHKQFDKQAVKNIIQKYSDDKQIVTECIFLFNESLFEYVSPKLQNDREFILEMVDKNCSILEYAPKKYHDDDEIMNKAINIMGYMVRVASDRLRNDKDFCLKAVKSQADAFSVLPAKMKEDKDLLMAAMSQRGEFLMYSPLVKTDKQLLIQAFSNAFPPQSRHLLSVTSEEFRNDPEVALAAINCTPDNLYNIGKQLREEIGDNDPVAYLSKDVNIENTTPEKVSKKKKM